MLRGLMPVPSHTPVRTTESRMPLCSGAYYVLPCVVGTIYMYYSSTGRSSYVYMYIMYYKQCTGTSEMYRCGRSYVMVWSA